MGYKQAHFSSVGTIAVLPEVESVMGLFIIFIFIILSDLLRERERKKMSDYFVALELQFAVPHLCKCKWVMFWRILADIVLALPSTRKEKK